MKTKEERNAFKNETEALNSKLAELNDEEIAQVSGGTYNGPCFVYVVKKGDCLSVLAHKYGTTVQILCEVNNIRNPDLLYEGNKLLIPYR